MKAKLQPVFENLPVEVRAAFYGTYLAVCDAAQAGDLEVIPHLLQVQKQQEVADSHAEDIAAVCERVSKILQDKKK